jgi:hypothetical protein
LALLVAAIIADRTISLTSGSYFHLKPELPERPQAIVGADLLHI